MTCTLEQEVSMPIRNPATSGVSRTFTFRGKVDKNQENVITDWKFTGDPQRVIDEAEIGCQGELYALGSMEGGQQIDGIVYRIIKTPGLQYSPKPDRFAVWREGNKQASKVYDSRIEADAELTVMRFKKPELKHWIEERPGQDRTPAEYQQRCYDWILAQEDGLTEWPIWFTKERLEYARHYLWNTAKQIIDAQRENRWLLNNRACHKYNYACPYINLCKAHRNNLTESAMFTTHYEFERTQRHPELDSDDPNILTFSSASTFALCQMMYKLRYFDGLRQTKEDREVLQQGSAGHVGMQEYFRTGDLAAAYKAVDAYDFRFNLIGEELERHYIETTSKVKAMVQAAANKWSVEGLALSKASTGSDNEEPDIF